MADPITVAELLQMLFQQALETEGPAMAHIRDARGAMAYVVISVWAEDDDAPPMAKNNDLVH